MISFAIIVFREVLEIALVLGILLAATRGLLGKGKWIWTGMGLGVMGSIVLACFSQTIANAVEGMGQEIFNAVILILAAVLIMGTVVWMRTHAKMLSQELKEIGGKVKRGEKPLYTLAIVIALTVLRDGAEIVMFTHGVLASGERIPQIVLGSLLGLGVGTAVGIAIYYGLIKMATRGIFSVTSWMLIFLSAGMVSQAFGFLAAAGFVPEIIYPLWDTSHFMPEDSLAGKIMHTLIGYCERPSGIQMLSYILTLAGAVLIMNIYNNFYLTAQTVRKVVIGVFIILGIGLLPQDAHATKKVYSPIVEGGELEVEVRGSYDFDDRQDKDGKQKQKYALGYGATAWWFTEIYGEIEKEPDADNFEFTSLEWENRFQLAEQGRFWVDPGLYLAYETTFGDETPEKGEVKLLLEKNLAKFTHTVNFILEQEFDVDEAELEAGFAWSSRYHWREFLEPGVEWHGELGKFSDISPYDEQKHQLGPVIYGKLFNRVKYDIGYLFGLTDPAAEGSLKWIVELEHHF